MTVERRLWEIVGLLAASFFAGLGLVAANTGDTS
jgi:hypothetical protein